MPVRSLAFVFALVAAASPAGAQPAIVMPLAGALARAREHSPAIIAARARSEAARAALARAGRPLNPFVELRSENWASGAREALPLDIFATVTQTVELGGKRGARHAVAVAGVDSATAAEAVAGRDLARVVVTDYLAALRARDHAATRQEFAVTLAEASRVVQRRVEVGAAPEADLLKLRAEETRGVLEQARADLALARALAALGATLGLDVAPDALALPAPPPLPADGVDAGAGHPDVRLAASHVAAGRAAAAVERSRAVPDLGITAGYKRTAGFDTGVAAVTVPIPLFDRNSVARALADGAVQASEHDRDAAAIRVGGALAAARRAATLLADRVQTIGPALVDPARGARDAARAAFAAGALDVLRLVDAERLYADAATTAVDLRVDAVAAAIEARLGAGEEPLP